MLQSMFVDLKTRCETRSKQPLSVRTFKYQDLNDRFLGEWRLGYLKYLYLYLTCDCIDIY